MPLKETLKKQMTSESALMTLTDKLKQTCVVGTDACN